MSSVANLRNCLLPCLGDVECIKKEFRGVRSDFIPLILIVCMIQVDIGGHPPFPIGSKQFFGNFGNLLFLAVFRVLKLPEPF
jgi:hypothetical protein